MERGKNPQHRRETNLKAQMAQSLVFDLLVESGNEVFKISPRTLLPLTLQIEDSLASHPTIDRKLRSIPDLLIIDRKGTPHLISVKFRWHPDGHQSDIAKIKKIGESWNESAIIFVNCTEKPYFRISYQPFVNKAGKLISSPITSHATFKISTALMSEFERLVVKYLTPTLFPHP